MKYNLEFLKQILKLWKLKLKNFKRMNFTKMKKIF